MKILRKNMKAGFIRMKTETPEDPWHLEKILKPGDVVTAKTTRRKTIKRGSELVRGERVTTTLAIELERSQLVRGERVTTTLAIELERSQLEAGQLRLRGRIVDGPKDMELASYHSISITPYMEVVVKKEAWTRQQLDRLKKAGVKEPLLFICVLDRDSADFASLKETGLDMLGSIGSRKILGKEDDRSEYYAEIAKILNEEAKTHNAVIVAGPGFEKENLFNYMKDNKHEVVKSISIENASHTGRTGIQEVIKTSANKVLKQTRVAKETELVERLLELIGKNGLVTYGKDQVRQAGLSGAIDTLLVSEEMVPENEGLMDSVEKMAGKVMIITSNHEAGERFLYLGGIGAFLRYKMN
jgi:protein pelota